MRDGSSAKTQMTRAARQRGSRSRGRGDMSEELTWAPAWRIRELITQREVSAIEVADHFLGRIQELNPMLQALSNVDPELVRAQAKAAEAAILAGESVGALHGVPTAVKSHIDIAG